jgi:hypothetical protein
MADYWLKLYIEILDDPKMATLPDRVWRRVIEMFLVAKRLNKDGHMPDTRQIAWLLRMPPDELEGDLAQIAQTGIMVREVNGWFIPKFAQRQAPVPGAVRQAQHRDKDKKQQYYGDVTDLSRSVTQSTEAETETETEAEVGDVYFSANPLSVAFVEASKIIAPGNNPKRWIDACEQMQKSGITPDEVKQAVFELNRKGYTIIGPSSIVTAAINVHNKSNGADKKHVYAETFQ